MGNYEYVFIVSARLPFKGQLGFMCLFTDLLFSLVQPFQHI